MRSWILSILVAALLSAAVTWFLSGVFRPGSAGHAASAGAGRAAAERPGCPGCAGDGCGAGAAR